MMWAGWWKQASTHRGIERGAGAIKPPSAPDDLVNVNHVFGALGKRAGNLQSFKQEESLCRISVGMLPAFRA
ncbi:MAG: hypothetical protein ACODAQ_06390, partial [Phycisphaeraceae bacterium]